MQLMVCVVQTQINCLCKIQVPPFCSYGKSRSANRRLLMLKPHASDQGPTPKPTYLSCVFWLTRDSHVTAAPGHVRAVLADESHHLIQVWGQLTGSDGPPFDVEERCAEVTAGEGLFPACERTQFCNQQHGIGDACTEVTLVSTQIPDKQKGQ